MTFPELEVSPGVDTIARRGLKPQGRWLLSLSAAGVDLMWCRQKFIRGNSGFGSRESNRRCFLRGLGCVGEFSTGTR